ncbi:MAG: hypothetical protein KAR13_22920, partial [Desulfobulbaceae bacterium]|nr:hypothetical protein [Desulfobulbaceae bacterium]
MTWEFAEIEMVRKTHPTFFSFRQYLADSSVCNRSQAPQMCAIRPANYITYVNRTDRVQVGCLRTITFTGLRRPSQV